MNAVSEEEGESEGRSAVGLRVAGMGGEASDVVSGVVDGCTTAVETVEERRGEVDIGAVVIACMVERCNE